ncbi:MAG: hypothetical protein ACI9Y1_001155 [Lentisphaeria bacterium]
MLRLWRKESSSSNKTSEAYTEKCIGRRGHADPKNWHSNAALNSVLRSTRGLTPAEVNTEASELVRMWRASGVKRLWHVHRDAFENLRYPFTPHTTLFASAELLKTRNIVETGLRWNLRVIMTRVESCEFCKRNSGRWLNGSRINHSTLSLGEPTTWGRI